MRPKYLKIVACLLISMAFYAPVYGAPVDRNLALTVGEMFIQRQMGTEVAGEGTMPTAFSPRQSQVAGVTALSNHAGETVAYVLEPAGGGYVVVSADTRIAPIVAYAYTGKFCFEDTQDNLLLQMVKADMSLRLAALPLLSEEEKAANQALWGEMQWNRTPYAAATWGPWVKTAWHQRSPYRDYCPGDPVTVRRTYAGAVATAMAQLIWYNKYPQKVSLGYADSYTTKTRRIKITPLDHLKYFYQPFYQLNKILKKIDYKPVIGYHVYQSLIFAAGISVKTDYTSVVSRADIADAAGAFKKKFKYKSARTYTNKGGAFFATMRANMKKQRPGMLGIYRPAYKGEHAVIVDGYKSSGEYHLNFGWGKKKNIAWYHLPGGMPMGYRIIKNGTFDVIPGTTLKVTYPNGGQKLIKGKRYTIKWKKGNGGKWVGIYLYKNGKKYRTVSKKTGNDGQHRWKVLTSYQSGTRYKIMIQSYTDKAVKDFSDKVFTISQ